MSGCYRKLWSSVWKKQPDKCHSLISQLVCHDNSVSFLIRLMQLGYLTQILLKSCELTNTAAVCYKYYNVESIASLVIEMILTSLLFFFYVYTFFVVNSFL